MLKHGIYQIFNVVTLDSYVGSAVDLTKRKNQHRSLLRRKLSENRILQRAWLKYGEANFEFRVLEQVQEKERLIEREQYFINTIKPKYNIRKQAQSNLGLTDTEDTKEKKSVAAKSRGQSKAQLRGLQIAQQNRIGVPVKGKVKASLALGPQSRIGKPVSSETRKKISEAVKGNTSYWKGKTLPEDVKKRISESKKGKPWTAAQREAHNRRKKN